MKIKKYLIAIVFGFFLVEFIWRGGLVKVLALPFSIYLLFDKSKEVFWALLLGAMASAVYFFNHGYSGAHDLKALLLILHFLIPVAICRCAINSREVFFLDILKMVFLLFLLSVLVVGEFKVNLLDASGDRFRGFFLFVLLALLQVYFKGSMLQRISLALFIGLLAFIISGSRQDSLILLISSLIIATRSRFLLVFIVIAYAFLPILVMLFGTFFPDDKGTIAVRSTTAKIAFDNFNLFGNGMIPPVKEFLANSDLGHFFVPADVMYFGMIYEAGFFVFFFKVIVFMIFALHFWRKVNPAIVIVSFSSALFDYHLTHMVFEFSASAIVFKYLRMHSS